jgi:hypothetical protein
VSKFCSIRGAKSARDAGEAEAITASPGTKSKRKMVLTGRGMQFLSHEVAANFAISCPGMSRDLAVYLIFISEMAT